MHNRLKMILTGFLGMALGCVAALASSPVLGPGTPPIGSVGTPQLADGGVTSPKIAAPSGPGTPCGDSTHVCALSVLGSGQVIDAGSVAISVGPGSISCPSGQVPIGVDGGLSKCGFPSTMAGGPILINDQDGGGVTIESTSTIGIVSDGGGTGGGFYALAANGPSQYSEFVGYVNGTAQTYAEAVGPGSIASVFTQGDGGTAELNCSIGSICYSKVLQSSPNGGITIAATGDAGILIHTSSGAITPIELEADNGNIDLVANNGAVTVGTASAQTGIVALLNASNAYYVGLESNPSTSASIIYQLPPTDAVAAGECLQSNASAMLSFQKTDDTCTLSTSGACTQTGFRSGCTPNCTLATTTAATIAADLGIGCTQATGTVSVQTGLSIGVATSAVNIHCQ